VPELFASKLDAPTPFLNNFPTALDSPGDACPAFRFTLSHNRIGASAFLLHQ
jgi:hypothetical protein